MGPKNTEAATPAPCPSSRAARSINTIHVKMSIDIGRSTGEARRPRSQDRAGADHELCRKWAHLPLTASVSLPIGAAEVSFSTGRGHAVLANAAGGGPMPPPRGAIREASDLPPRPRRPPAAPVLGAVVADMKFRCQGTGGGPGERAALDGNPLAGRRGDHAMGMNGTSASRQPCTGIWSARRLQVDRR